MKLKSKVAIVTGAASGIGEAIAVRFAEEGASICVPDKNLEGAENTVKKIETLGGDGLAFATDVTDIAAVENTVKETIDAFGKIDILVNNAGISWSKLILDTTVEDWDLMIRTHLHSCFYFSRTVAESMVEKQNGGKILNLSSINGIMGSVGRGAYGAAKGGTITLTRVMAVEFAQYGINVNVLAPGPILTPMLEPLWDDVREYPKDVPLKRFGTLQDISSAALFLCSNESDYITGTTFPVDGGFCIAGKIDRTMPD